MKLNIYDKTLEGVVEIIEKVSDSIAGDFKGVNPFDKRPMTKDEKMGQFNQMSPEEKLTIFEELQRRAK